LTQKSTLPLKKARKQVQESRQNPLVQAATVKRRKRPRKVGRILRKVRSHERKGSRRRKRRRKERRPKTLLPPWNLPRSKNLLVPRGRSQRAKRGRNLWSL